jgi:hypothetical protein
LQERLFMRLGEGFVDLGPFAGGMIQSEHSCN